MQQPLCHLYFITVTEHLFSAPRDIENLVRVGETISQVLFAHYNSDSDDVIFTYTAVSKHFHIS